MLNSPVMANEYEFIVDVVHRCFPGILYSKCMPSLLRPCEQNCKTSTTLDPSIG